MAPRRKTRSPQTSRCLRFQHFALATYLKRKSYSRMWGQKRCKSKKVYRERIDPMVRWPRIKDFQARFRLPPSCVEELTREFEASRFRPGKGEHEKRGKPIPLFHKVCYCLRYLATGSYYGVVSDTQGGCSTSSIGRAILPFIKFLVSRRKKYIKFPKGEALHESTLRFAERHKMPQCVGCIDGTYIPIKRPVRNEHAYVCRKGYHALNVLIASDHDERITFVESGMSGCHHDQAVLDYSDLGQQIANHGRLGPYFLLGDGGYALTPQVFTPFRTQNLEELEPWQRDYQFAQTSARSSVERTIGQLKSRWRCLSKSGGGVIEMHPLQASWVVKACCVLHNRCIDWGLRKLKPGQNRDPDLEMTLQVNARYRFLLNNRNIDREEVADHDQGPNTRDNPSLEGIQRRDNYIYAQYGGPIPQALRQPAGRGRGRRGRRPRGARNVRGR